MEKGGGGGGVVIGVRIYCYEILEPGRGGGVFFWHRSGAVNPPPPVSVHLIPPSVVAVPQGSASWDLPRTPANARYLGVSWRKASPGFWTRTSARSNVEKGPRRTLNNTQQGHHRSLERGKCQCSGRARAFQWLPPSSCDGVHAEPWPEQVWTSARALGAHRPSLLLRYGGNGVVQPQSWPTRPTASHSRPSALDLHSSLRMPAVRGYVSFLVEVCHTLMSFSPRFAIARFM